jgi:hypothetical protein
MMRDTLAPLPIESWPRWPGRGRRRKTIPIALDGTRLDTPAKLIAYLEEINAARQAANRQPPV